MQEKLSKNSTQVDLLQELLNLQKDLIVMLLSMLEGNVLNGTIGKQMVDTLVESAGNVEMILEYFKLFLNLPGEEDVLADSTDGTIPPKDFKEILEGTKNYREVQLDFTPEIEVFYMLFERCHIKNRQISHKQHIKYF